MTADAVLPGNAGSGSVRVEVAGPVTTIVLARPERRNAVDGPMAADLADAFRAFEEDPDAAVAVLWGEGGSFCAGADLKAVGTGRSNRLDPQGDGPMGPTRLQLSKPVIAAIEGYAVAGGLELALWCDLRLAGEGSFLGVSCRRWGVPLVDGGTVRLPRLIGQSRALDMILTGRLVDATEALQFGLVNRVVPSGAARRVAEELAIELSRFPQTCLRNDRRSVHHQAGLDEERAMAFEFEVGMESFAAGAVAGARRFAAGAGRHGMFESE